jgi:hypothetical protein
MDKQFIIHIVTEIVILSSISIYFHKRNKSLENSIKELRKELYNLQLAFVELQQTVKFLTHQPTRINPQFNSRLNQSNINVPSSILNNKLVEQMIADNTIIPLTMANSTPLHPQQSVNRASIGGSSENPLLGGIMNMMPMFTSMMMGSFTSKPKDETDDKVVITDENDDDSLIESTINDLTSDDVVSTSDLTECKDGVCSVNLEELVDNSENSE